MRKDGLKRRVAKAQRRGDFLIGVAAGGWLLVLTLAGFGQGVSVKNALQNGDFPLVYDGRAAAICVAETDFKVAKIAAADFAADVERVTGRKPAVVSDTEKLPETLVLISTLGKNPLIDKLIADRQIDASGIAGKRETFLLETVRNPFPGVRAALVIAGSDRRGTAFGVYEMSQRIGVSPWVWWADAAPEKRRTLVVSKGKFVAREPSVKYRGIFLNDEDWGLEPWAAKTFEPESGNIGPKTYAKIFELLLRLKANACWPAMHEVTRPFNALAENARVADDYAIVIGSSHAEPMLRNNVGEWKDDKEKYNFVTNAAGVTAYWEDRLKTNAGFENVYTLGMRGIHDSPIQGTKTQAERIPVLERIIATQRGLLAKYADRPVEKVPQIFCPYKEVLADYRAGLKVPDDVTLVFPDDNFGYIRYFPNETERKRAGGFGVYYHISYLGRPLSYLWLNSTPPALIFEELSKAYANGMRDFWMLNVGDLKPAETGIEFFMQMAYDAGRWNVANQHEFLREWAAREFGARYADDVASIMDEYYRLGFQRKPEHLQWYLPGEKPRPSELTEQETGLRLEAYASLVRRAESFQTLVPAAKKDAFYELVHYPVKMAALANERFFYAELAEKYRALDESEALPLARRSIAADREIDYETNYFNEKLADGKWRFMMSPEMREGQWTGMRAVRPRLSEKDFEVDRTKPEPPPSSYVWLAPGKLPKIKNGFAEWNGAVSIEVEHFTRAAAADGFAWRTIRGLGKTGDSVTVFPPVARTFERRAPRLEYRFEILNAGAFDADFYLLPTRPLVPGNGLRFAVAIDDGPPQTIAVDRDTEVSSPGWAQNILNQTTRGGARFELSKGIHVLKIFAVDTGVVLDKVVLRSGPPTPGYFGPPETFAP
ncbi:MAG: glycosyl hydrolase 115 family protein [Acidobacteria bacterium]|nr:glycosyl hydrolase 115 family protein [Acidobacteriota bacterium]